MQGSELLPLSTPCSELQVEIWHNPAAPPGGAGVVLFHPWAKLGGTMDDPTVTAIFRAAVQSGLFTAVCRYNMAGAGASRSKWNKHRLLNDPDVSDAVAVCEHLLSLPGGNAPSQLFAVGYSFGACVAAQVLSRVPRVAGYVAVGFPLSSITNLALRSRQAWSLLAESPAPKLLLAGTRDKFSPLSTLREYTAQYHAHEPEPGPLDLAVIDGADHMFDGHWEAVADRVVAWLHVQADKVRAGSA